MTIDTECATEGLHFMWHKIRKIIRLPSTDRLPNCNRTDINRLPTLPIKLT
jgi:tRNA U38,U39,U40 pseudouridine synthase TruA